MPAGDRHGISAAGGRLRSGGLRGGSRSRPRAAGIDVANQEPSSGGSPTARRRSNAIGAPSSTRPSSGASGSSAAVSSSVYRSLPSRWPSWSRSSSDKPDRSSPALVRCSGAHASNSSRPCRVIEITAPRPSSGSGSRSTSPRPTSRSIRRLIVPGERPSSAPSRRCREPLPRQAHERGEHREVGAAQSEGHEHLLQPGAERGLQPRQSRGDRDRLDLEVGSRRAPTGDHPGDRVVERRLLAGKDSARRGVMRREDRCRSVI